MLKLLLNLEKYYYRCVGCITSIWQKKAKTLGQRQQFSCLEVIWLCRDCIHTNKFSYTSKYHGIRQANNWQLFLAHSNPQGILGSAGENNNIFSEKKKTKTKNKLKTEQPQTYKQFISMDNSLQNLGNHKFKNKVV